MDGKLILDVGGGIYSVVFYALFFLTCLQAESRKQGGGVWGYYRRCVLRNDAFDQTQRSS